MFKYLCSLFFFISTLFVFGQQQIDYSNSTIKEMAKKVFKDCPQYAKDEYIELYKKRFDKVTVIQLEADREKRKKEQNYLVSKKLSALTLKNKCNANLDYDTGEKFNPKAFNVLKYFFPIPKGRKVLYVKVDDTDYIIKVEK